MKIAKSPCLHHQMRPIHQSRRLIKTVMPTDRANGMLRFLSWVWASIAVAYRRFKVHRKLLYCVSHCANPNQAGVDIIGKRIHIPTIRNIPAKRKTLFSFRLYHVSRAMIAIVMIVGTP